MEGTPSNAPVGGRLTLSDVAVAVALVVVGALEAALVGEGTARFLLVALQVAAAAPLAWRRSRPAWATLAATGAIVATEAVDRGEDLLTVFVCLLLAMFSLGLHADRRAFRWALAASATLLATTIIVAGEGVDDVVYVGAIVLGTVVPARLVRRKLDDVADATERAVRAELELEDRARLAALEERGRLAYELHDIVGHSVSLMAVQAAAAEARLADPELARASLQTVQEVGRQAIADLARMLGLLREDHAELGLTVQPGPADLAQLADDARSGGDQLTMVVEGDTGRIPTALGLTVYRIVQEGLTNARRHAPGAAVHAAVEVSGRCVTVEVRNDRATREAGAMPGTGTGLLGLRARVGMFGGSLQSGHGEDGGFVLRASLPMDGVAP